MKLVKANWNTVLGIAAVMLTAFHFVLFQFGYLYRPKSYIVFFALYLALTTSATVLSIQWKQDANRISRVFGCVMPVIAFVYVVSLHVAFDLSIDYKTYHLRYDALLCVTSVVPSFVLFFIHNKIQWLRGCAVLFSGILVASFGYMLFILLIFVPLGESQILQTAYSPNHTYVAWAVSHDEGALGGDTCVNVRNISRDIPCLIGTLTARSETIWSGGWGAEPALEWEDDDTLLINGRRYPLADRRAANDRNNALYHAKLGVYVPQREPNAVRDTHGGFHGDGERLETFVLSAEETERMQQNVAENAFWHSIHPENKRLLYGGAEGYWMDGLLQGHVPDIENGYCCVYNKQTNVSEFPKADAYSCNDMIGIYPADDNILYILEMDT